VEILQLSCGSQAFLCRLEQGNFRGAICSETRD